MDVEELLFRAQRAVGLDLVAGQEFAGAGDLKQGLVGREREAAGVGLSGVGERLASVLADEVDLAVLGVGQIDLALYGR